MRWVPFAAAVITLSSCTPVWEGQARRLPTAAAERPIVISARDQAALPADDAPAIATLPNDVDALIALGLERHPQIRARLSAVDRLANRAEASGSLPPPQLQVAPYGEMAQTASGEVVLMAGVSQRFPAPGSLGAKVAMADADTRQAEAAVHAMRVIVAGQIRTAWWNRHLAQTSAALTDAQIALLEQLRGAVLQRIASGQDQQSSALRLGVEIDRLQTMRRAWQERTAIADAALRQAMALPAGTILPDGSPRLSPIDRYQADELVAQGQQFRADVMAILAKDARAEALALAASARRRPDFGLSINYNVVDDSNLMGSTSGDDQWWVGASVSLPIWFGSYAASDREAEAALREATFERLAINDTIRREVDSALAAWQSSLEQLALYDGGLTAQAEQAYAAELGNYASGLSGYTGVIQAARQLLMLEMNRLRLERDAGAAEASLLQAAGLCFPNADSMSGRSDP